MSKARFFALVLAGFAALAMQPSSVHGDNEDASDSAGAGISVTISPPTAVLDGGGRQVFTATVENDPAHAGVKWKVTGLGKLSAASSTTAPFESTYIAPATVPLVTRVTVTATSIEDPTKSAAAK